MVKDILDSPRSFLGRVPVIHLTDKDSNAKSVHSHSPSVWKLRRTACCIPAPSKTAHVALQHLDDLGKAINSRVSEGHNILLVNSWLKLTSPSQ